MRRESIPAPSSAPLSSNLQPRGVISLSLVLLADFHYCSCARARYLRCPICNNDSCSSFDHRVSKMVISTASAFMVKLAKDNDSSGAVILRSFVLTVLPQSWCSSSSPDPKLPSAVVPWSESKLIQ